MNNTGKMALVLAGVMFFGASASWAAIDVKQCQTALNLARRKFEDKVILRTTACANKIAGENAKAALGKATDYSKVAAYCELQLSKTYVDEVAKLRTAIDKAAGVPDPSTAKCDATTFTSNGILLSGAGNPAPGVTPQKFIEDYLLATGEQMGIASVIKSTPNLGNLILQAQNAAAGADPAPDCKGANTTPHLCAFKVECTTRACTLKSPDSQSSLQSAAAGPLSFNINGVESFDVCTINGALAGAGLESNFLYLSGSPGRTLQPVVIPGVATVCVDVLGGSGWVDCTGHGLPLNTSFCQDRIVQDGENPDQCGAPAGAATPDTNAGFDGTKIGLPVNTPGGASVANSAFDVNTIQFSIETTTDLGVDGLPCTADDTVTPNAPVPVPLTTGTAQAQVLEAVQVPGVCDDLATGCIEDKNCVANGGGCAGGVGSGCCTGVTLTTVNSGLVGPGVGKTCASWEAGTLSGLKLVGAFPGGGGTPPLGDTTTAFTIVCQ